MFLKLSTPNLKIGVFINAWQNQGDIQLKPIPLSMSIVSFTPNHQQNCLQIIQSILFYYYDRYIFAANEVSYDIEIYPPGPQVVHVGDDVLLKCRAVVENPKQSLKWTRSDSKLISDRIEEISDGNILISNITAAEAGEYVCHGSYGLNQEITKASTITIQQSLSSVNIFPKLAELSLVEEDKLNLYCTADFISNVMWYKLDASDQFENITQKAFPALKSATYKKYNVSQNDSGTYICRAKHEGRQTEKQIKVLVQPKQNTGELIAIIES